MIRLIESIAATLILFLTNFPPIIEVADSSEGDNELPEMLDKDIPDIPEMPDRDFPDMPEMPQDDYYPDRYGMHDRYGDRYGDQERYPGEARRNEAIVGDKRYKLYEKKRLVYYKARKFCRERNGQLVNLKSIGPENMGMAKGMEKIFRRAMELRVDIWTAIDDKEWNDSLRKVAGEGADNQTMERAMKKLCPALSMGRGGVTPVSCKQSLPYICQYRRNRPRTTRKPKGNTSFRSSRRRRWRGGREEMK